MTHDYDPLAGVAFNEFVTYKCIPGHFFKDDRDRESEKIMCHDTGNLDFPVGWAECVSGEVNTVMTRIFF